jgi:hypothetical protein
VLPGVLPERRSAFVERGKLFTPVTKKKPASGEDAGWEGGDGPSGIGPTRVGFVAPLGPSRHISRVGGTRVGVTVPPAGRQHGEVHKSAGSGSARPTAARTRKTALPDSGVVPQTSSLPAPTVRVETFRADRGWMTASTVPKIGRVARIVTCRVRRMNYGTEGGTGLFDVGRRVRGNITTTFSFPGKNDQPRSMWGGRPAGRAQAAGKPPPPGKAPAGPRGSHRPP